MSPAIRPDPMREGSACSRKTSATLFAMSLCETWWTSKRDTRVPAVERTMLTIRRAQLAAFSRADAARFEQWMLDHLRKFFAKQCEAAGEPDLRETIRYGIERAAAHGFHSKRDICKYIDLMVVLGRDFDA